MTVSEAAHAWQAAGVSTIPILPGGTKRPAVKWADYQAHLPTVGEVSHWWGNGQEYGLALIMGQVSGGLEMLELEGRAIAEDAFARIRAVMQERGIEDLWEDFLSTYTEESPSGGVHLIYHISDHPVPGNLKVARRPATAEELAVSPRDKVRVLAETRGEGGYVIVAPTPGICHPSGKQWVKVFGEYGTVASVTWETRCAIFDAVTEALDTMPLLPDPVPAPLPGVPAGTGSSSALVPWSPQPAGVRPGDDWANRYTWSDLLQADGWTLSHRTGEEEFWVRPGKNRHDGHSASVNFRGCDLLKVFSSSVEYLEPEQTYSRFGYYTATRHNGDHKAASQELARQGFGSQRPAPAPIEGVELGGQVAMAAPVTQDRSLDEVGNAQRLRERTRDRFIWSPEENMFRHWDRGVWRLDETGAVVREWIAITDEMLRSPDEQVRKHATRGRSERAVRATVNLLKQMPGVSLPTQHFDQDKGLLNVVNGTINLETGEFGPHDPRNLITRVFGASYDPQATCPNFDRFIEQALPDPEMRAYTQRAMGYSLLGHSDQRSLFIIHGPSGTGKSTLIDTMTKVFGDYAATAPQGAFKAHRTKDSGPTNDLHLLKGRRFVTSSETSEYTTFDEDLLKRMTGNDQVVSRNLYEKNQTWTPECAIWLATNHPPKFSSDDNAIWKRLKLIPFMTEFAGRENGEVPGLANKVLAKEADGILNWLLAGLRDYLERGYLDAPESVSDASQLLRSQSDSVIRFIEEGVEDGILERDPEAMIRTVELHRMYVQWCRDNGERSVVGSRRFTNRLLSRGSGMEHTKTNRQMYWKGIRRGQGVSVLGSMIS